MNKKSIILIFLAGVFWGTLSIGVRGLGSYGLSSMQITASRWIVSGLLITIFGIIFNRKNMKVSIKDIPWFASMGIFSTLACSTFYFISINETSAAIADILMYTSPIWVMIMSAVFFKDKITKRKLLCVVLVFLGCALASGFVGESNHKFGVWGIVSGILSGVAYGLYSILSKNVVNKYDSFAILTYCSIFSCIASLFIPGATDAISLYIHKPMSILPLLFMSLAGTITPYFLYTIGLKKVDPPTASIVSAVEPVTALIISVFLLNEPIAFIQVIGIIFILSSIVIMNTKKKINA